MSEQQDAVGPSLEREFRERLLAAVQEVREHTHLGVNGIIEDIKGIGAVAAARARLRKRDRTTPLSFFNQPSEYFLATKRVEKMHLSVEALALDPRWAPLFTQAERDEAAQTLTEHDFTPALEASDLPVGEDEPGFAPILHDRGGFGVVDAYRFSQSSSECEATQQFAAKLREGRQPYPSRLVRQHLNKCTMCRTAHAELVNAYERFDEHAACGWRTLLHIFAATMELDDDRLRRFHYLTPEDYKEPDHYELDLEARLDDQIRPVCAWRAVRAGCQLGRFMNAYASTFTASDDAWLQWRNDEARHPMAVAVRQTDQRRFALALAAQLLLVVRSWEHEEHGILWLPADEDLHPLPGIIHVEPAHDLDEWEEVLGPPPQHLNLIGILYLAQRAGIAELERREPRAAQAPDIGDQLDNLKADLLRGMQDIYQEHAERQNAIFDELGRMGMYIETSDRHACEEALIDKLEDVYPKLKPEVRSLLLGSEQMARTPGFATPGKIIDVLATAYEVQLRHSVMAWLFDHLKQKGVRLLRPLPEWRDVEYRDKPLWSPSDKPEKCTLGTMRLILRHNQPEIQEFFTDSGLDRECIQQATEEVYSRRNDAVHGTPFDTGTAAAIKEDWYTWQGRCGGVYATLFRNR